MKKILLIGAVVSMTAMSLAGAEQRPPELVSASRVKMVDSVISKRYVGTLVSSIDVSLVPRISGIIEKKLFENGDLVKKGQLLFKLEDTTYRAQVASARAKVAQCEAEFKFASANFKRISTLRKQNAVSESSYEEAVRLEGTSKAALAAARAALIDAENNLSYTKITSPIDGRVGDAVLSDFNYVTPGSGTLVTVVATEPLYLDFSISARDFYKYFGSLENIRETAEITFALADGSKYNQKAYYILLPDNRVDKDTDTIKIRGYFRNPDLKLIPDSLVSVYISRKSGKKAALPPSAVLSDGKNVFVLVLDKNNTVSRRPVVLDELQSGMQLIASGLKEGEVVVVDGTHKARPGAVVKPVFVENK